MPFPDGGCNSPPVPKRAKLERENYLPCDHCTTYEEALNFSEFRDKIFIEWSERMKRISVISQRFLLGAILSAAFCALPPHAESVEMAWDSADFWEAQNDGASRIDLSVTEGKFGAALRIRYSLKPNGWVQIRKKTPVHFTGQFPITFWIKAESPSVLEVKLEDEDGSNFIRRIPLKDQYKNWARVALYFNNFDYGWGGDDKLGEVKNIYFAVSGAGAGTIYLDQVGISDQKLEATFLPAGPALDPDRALPGLGFRQRRDDQLTPEDPMVLEWIKANQDTSSPEKRLVSSMGDNIAQTFNNALCAMVFILKKDKERAERILDYYASAMKPENSDPTLQSFFYRGKAMGFFQSIQLTGDKNTAYHSLPSDDRWVGDMAWLLIAYKYYEKTYQSKKYELAAENLKRLLISFFKPDRVGGYVQSGWSKGDSKFHETGYGEPNIDCYSAFMLTGEKKLADEIKKWLDATLKGPNLPLDNYSWRVLAFGPPAADVLNTVEHDLRFRKTMDANGRKVAGFYHSPDDIKNIWLDGIGHMSCAFFAVGNLERGNFYANQYDALLMDQEIGGRRAKGFPYTLNKLGGNEWVDPHKAHVSVSVWYIFAKNRFNPLTLMKSDADPSLK